MLITLLLFFNFTFASEKKCSNDLTVKKNCYYISNAQIIDKKTTIENSTITFSEGAKVIVKNDFSLKNNNIIWRIQKSTSDINKLFIIQSGTFSLNKNIINTSLGTSFKVKTPDLKPKNWFIYKDSKKQSKIRIINNISTNKEWYTTGFLKIKNVSDVRVEDNTLENFHGGIYLENVYQASIKYNFFRRNSFDNINISGENINISFNNILFSGNGTAGDGIGIFDSNNLKITNNTVHSSSCYGIQFVKGKISNTTISNNVINTGITTALYFAEPTVIENTTISDNTFSFNTGLALAILSDSKSVIIRKNLFQENSIGPNKKQHVIVGTPKEWKDNLKGFRLLESSFEDQLKRSNGKNFEEYNL